MVRFRDQDFLQLIHSDGIQPHRYKHIQYMKSPLFLLFFLLPFSVFAQKQTALTDYVNPLMGSQSRYDLSNGNTYPAIALPWGMNFWTPETGKMGDGWQYTYD